MQKVLVTGGAGRLARFAIPELLAHGYEVLAVDCVRPERLQCRFIRADLTDPAVIYDVLRGIDAVLHLAAVPGPNVEPSSVIFRTNVVSTFQVVEAAAALGVPRFVFASSLFALGWHEDPQRYWPQYVPLDETHPLTPFEAYGLSKVLGEEMLAAACRRTGMTGLSLRFTNIVQVELHQALPWPTPTPASPVRFMLWPYVDVRDAGRACRLALQAETSGHEALFIAANDLRFDAPTEALLRQFAPQVEIRRPLPGRATVLNLDKARRLIGFEPQFTWQSLHRDEPPAS